MMLLNLLKRKQYSLYSYLYDRIEETTGALTRVVNTQVNLENNLVSKKILEFSKQSKAILDTMIYNNDENEKLSSLRDSLLPKLMSE